MDVRAARAAFEAGDWDAAAEHAQAAIDAGEVGPGLDLLSQVRWMQCRIQEGLELRERAYAELRRSGDRCGAATAALWLAVEYSSSHGAVAVANGWMRRAEGLLEGSERCHAHVELEVARARRASSLAAAREHFDAGLREARALGSPDAENRVLSTRAVVEVEHGNVEVGMQLLDESMAAVLGGELSDPWAIGGACCQMLAACDAAADWPRAVEWCRYVLPAVERRGMVPLWAWCRSVYGGVLTAVGDWERAEEELLESLRTYGGQGEPMAAYPLARLAELRIRQGRYEEAERLIEGVDHHPRAVSTGIALLLARGKPQAAASACDRRLARIGARSPGAAALLPLLVDARLALGDVDGAAAAADQLAELARSLGRPHLTAAAESALASVSMAAGRPAAAAAHLETALEIHASLGMPLESARARLGLARVLVAEGEADLAIDHARAAVRVFEQLGARPDADDAAAVLRTLGVAGRTGARLGAELTGREQEVLALLGEGLSNAQIAERLVISPKTAEHHVSRVLRKLGLTSRTEAAAHAARGLLRGQTPQ